jgi:hypothetical protein
MGGPIKRSALWAVQAMCALAEIAPSVRGALDEKSFAYIDAVLDSWAEAEQDVFPLLLLRDGGGKEQSVTKPREIYLHHGDVYLTLRHARANRLGEIIVGDWLVDAIAA